MSWDIYLKNGRGFLHTTLWVPKEANGIGVVFSHGWGGAHVFGDLHQRLAGWGFTVASLEQRGYWEATGKGRLVVSLKDHGSRDGVAPAAGPSGLDDGPLHRWDHGAGDRGEAERDRPRAATIACRPSTVLRASSGSGSSCSSRA
jgi:hypothetical protein